MSGWGWGRYVPVAERRLNAMREMVKLRKKGKNICPVEIEGRTIARTFWGKGWCEHLESFSDYDNRLPRGRTYARNGSVCHLEISKGKISAIVSGSELYKIRIGIKRLPKARWDSIKQHCAGRIGSMLELLQGKISKEVMEVVANRTNGLFPLPGEMKFTCSCPDWAVMCKHVAAVLYGVGNRLDCDPGLLFELRGVDAQELIARDMHLLDSQQAGQDDGLADQDLGDLFGIEMDAEVLHEPAGDTSPQPSPEKTTKASRKQTSKAASGKNAKTGSTTRKARTKTSSAAGTTKPTTGTVKNKPASKPISKPAKPKRFCPTGPQIRKLRQAQGLSFQEFADKVGSCEGSVRRWESKRAKTNLRADFLQVMQEMFEKM